MKTRKNENSSKLREQPFAEEFSDMGWVGGVVSSVSCRASQQLSGIKGDFVWAGFAGRLSVLRAVFCIL